MPRMMRYENARGEKFSIQRGECKPRKKDQLRRGSIPAPCPQLHKVTLGNYEQRLMLADARPLQVPRWKTILS